MMRKTYRFLKLCEKMLASFTEWFEFFSPEWEEEKKEKEAKKKAKKEGVEYAEIETVKNGE